MIFTQSYAIGAISECAVLVWALMGENERSFRKFDIETTTLCGSARLAVDRNVILRTATLLSKRTGLLRHERTAPNAPEIPRRVSDAPGRPRQVSQ